MGAPSKKGLRPAILLFWILLAYIVAALVWWFVSLEKQSDTIFNLRKELLKEQELGTANYQAHARELEDQQRRNTMKYQGEGATFLLLIILGAVYMYRLVRRQFQVQQQQQNFLMAVTHELKTPVSVARLNLETLQKHQLPDEKRMKLVTATIEETARLDTLINNLLLSAQLDDAGFHADRSELDLSDLVQDSIQAFRGRYPDRELSSSIQPELAIRGDAFLLKLLLSNLLENANKYAPRGTPVHVELKGAGKRATLTVSDQGPGIADSEKKKVFRKFYRVGNEQTRTAKGTGLGLFICQKIAGHHQATISVTDGPNGGARFHIIFTTADN